MLAICSYNAKYLENQLPSGKHIEDILTKGNLRPNFEFLVSKLGMIDNYAPT